MIACRYTIKQFLSECSMEHSIIVENISKKYDISKLKKETQFREALVNLLKRTFSGIKKIKKKSGR